jgi:hypothetical protein
MGDVFSPKVRLWLAAVATFIALAYAWTLGSQAAQAGASNYCSNVTLTNYAPCVGVPRLLYQTYGWGDERSVCVWYRTGGWGSNGSNCSIGPGYGIYSAQTVQLTWEPGINVNAPGTSRVHGVALSE